jgi:signal-transduction protein with cAMP-binding, CBS, and nucleotidyltransferase domain
MTERAEVEIVRRYDPVLLPPTASIMMAARHMHAQHVSAVLVAERDGTLLGIFTERDAISRVLAVGKDPVSTTLAEVMTDNPETVSVEDDASEIVHLMRAAHCRHLPIIYEGKAIGMVSRGQFAGKHVMNRLEQVSVAVGVKGSIGKKAPASFSGTG